MLSFIAYLALAAQVHAESAASFLRTMQQPDGGFISDQLKPGQKAQPTLRTTRTALRTFRLLQADVPRRDDLIAFHAACYDKQTGGFSAYPGAKPDPISTSVGLMILRELKLPNDDYLQRGLEFMNEHTEGFEQIRMVASSLEEFNVSVPNARKWVQQMRADMNQDGTWGNGPAAARTTALYGVAVQRLGGAIDKEAVLRVLRAGQRTDGGFGNDSDRASDLESCYRVVRLFHRLKAAPDRIDDLRGFIARCKNSDGGYGRTPQQPSSLHGTYYATIVGSWLDDLQTQNLESTRRHWNFDAEPLDNVPAGWKAANTPTAQTCHWQIKASDEGRSLAQTSTAGLSKQFNLCVSDYRAINVDIKVRLRPLAGDGDRGGGVVWRYTDPRNYYVARWNPLENNFRVYKVVAGVRSQLDTATVTPQDDWRTLRIIAYGRSMRGYLDDKLLLEAEDDQFDQPGLVGLWSKADAVTEFDDLQVVTALPEDLEDMPIPTSK